jgi:hypothetical protein
VAVLFIYFLFSLDQSFLSSSSNPLVTYHPRKSAVSTRL